MSPPSKERRLEKSQSERRRSRGGRVASAGGKSRSIFSFVAAALRCKRLDEERFKRDVEPAGAGQGVTKDGVEFSAGDYWSRHFLFFSPSSLLLPFLFLRLLLDFALNSLHILVVVLREYHPINFSSLFYLHLFYLPDRFFFLLLCSFLLFSCVDGMRAARRVSECMVV